MTQRTAHALRTLVAAVATAAAMVLILGMGQASAADRTDVLAPPDLLVSNVTASAVTVTNSYALYGAIPAIERPTATAGAFRITVATFRTCTFPCVLVAAGSKEVSVSSLAPGASVVVPIWDLGGPLVDVRVDRLDQVYERDETNNMRSFRRF
jgi:hypothetical protein